MHSGSEAQGTHSVPSSLKARWDRSLISHVLRTTAEAALLRSAHALQIRNRKERPGRPSYRSPITVHRLTLGITTKTSSRCEVEAYVDTQRQIASVTPIHCVKRIGYMQHGTRQDSCSTTQQLTATIGIMVRHLPGTDAWYDTTGSARRSAASCSAVPIPLSTEDGHITHTTPSSHTYPSHVCFACSGSAEPRSRDTLRPTNSTRLRHPCLWPNPSRTPRP